MICVRRSSLATCQRTAIGPFPLSVRGGVTRVQRITRSARGSPLATPCWNSFDVAGRFSWAEARSGQAAADAVVKRKRRRESGGTVTTGLMVVRLAGRSAARATVKQCEHVGRQRRLDVDRLPGHRMDE